MTTPAHVTFHTVNLEGGSFQDVNLRKARFENINLSYSRFDDINFSDAVITENCNFRGMTLCDIPVATLLETFHRVQQKETSPASPKTEETAPITVIETDQGHAIVLADGQELGPLTQEQAEQIVHLCQKAFQAGQRQKMLEIRTSLGL